MDGTAIVRSDRVVSRLGLLAGLALLATTGCSVLTPIGAALIGLSVGQSIEWRTVSGGTRQLTVLAATS